jgi:hypothetical protein
MDFELLNFWINKIGFDIRHDKVDEHCYLYMSLKADKEDFMNSYIILLSSNRDAILQFFGFDISIKYDSLSERNLFEYLSTSSILKPYYLKFCSFKGPRPKNKLHEKFNKYLLDKNYPQKDDNISIKQQSINFKNDAISYFGKEKEFLEYKEKRAIFDSINQKKHYLMSNQPEQSYVDFTSFLAVHGIINVASMNEETLMITWDAFSKQNWSGIRRYGL